MLVYSFSCWNGRLEVLEIRKKKKKMTWRRELLFSFGATYGLRTLEINMVFQIDRFVLLPSPSTAVKMIHSRVLIRVLAVELSW